MTTLQKLSVKQIQKSPGHFWTTVVGVMISTALILAVLLGSTSAMDAMCRFHIAQDGYWHWSLDQLPAQIAASLDGDEGSTQWGTFGGQLQATAEDGTLFYLYGVRGNFLEMMQTEIVEGDTPTSPQELLIPKALAVQNGLSLGDSIQMTAEDGTAYSGTVCGIYTHSVLNGRLIPPDSGFTLYYGTDWDNPIGADSYRFFSVSDTLDNKYFAHTEQVTDQVRHTAPNAPSIYARMLIALSGASAPDGDNRISIAINALRAVLVVIVGMASGMMIVNAFSISLTQRRRTLGMLVSAGATAGQAALCLLYEALYVAAVGIPLGLIAGFGGLAITFRLLSPLFQNMQELFGADISLHLSFDFGMVALSVLVSLVMVLCSAWMPAHRFSKISVMQAIKGEGEVEVSPRVTKAGKWVRKVFGAPAAVAVKSAKRNRRRYTATVRSLAGSIALLIAASGLGQCLNELVKIKMDGESFPISVAYAASVESLSKTAVFDHLLNPQTPVQNVVVAESVLLDAAKIPASLYNSQVIKLAAEMNQSPQNESYLVSIELQLIPDEDFQRLAQHTSSQEDSLSCIVANRYFYDNQIVTQTQAKPGDMIQAELKGIPVNLAIAGVDNTEFVKQRYSNPAGLILLTSREQMDQMVERWEQASGEILPRSVQVQYQTDVPLELKEELKALEYNTQMSEGMQDYLLVSDNRMSLAFTQILHLLVNVIVYGFSGLIGLICACHTATTIYTGLCLQQKEFAVIQSMGGTQQQIWQMILTQSLVHSAEAVLWGLPIEFALLGVEYFILRMVAAFFFPIPWVAIVLSVLAAFAIALLCAAVYMRRWKKESILHYMRTSE